MADRDFDIAVCGAGLAGMVTASLLSASGFRVALLDARALPAWRAGDPVVRVSSLNLAAIRVLEHLDAWRTIAGHRCHPYRCIAAWDGGSDARIDFDAHSIGQTRMGCIVENDLVTSVVGDIFDAGHRGRILARTALLGIEAGDDGIRIETDNGVIDCELLVAADGARSRVRELAGIEVDHQDFQQDAIVATVTLDTDSDHTAWQCFRPSGPIGILPLGGQQYSIVWSCDREQAQEIINLNDAGFIRALDDAIEQTPGAVLKSGRRYSFPLHQQHARSYLAPRVVLVGDAAHTTHPLAGLGANIGILDAAALSEVLGDARAKGAAIHKTTVLRRYERWRRGENALVLEIMNGFKNVFGTDNALVQGARRFGFGIAGSVDPLNRLFVRFATAVDGDLPRICRADRH